MRLAGKVALVAGAGSCGPGWGNGKAAAVLFAREGAAVFAVDRDVDAARETAAIIADEGGTATAFACDVSVSAQVQAAVSACVERYGGLDVLHNNVGVLAVGGPVELEEADWDRQVAVNLTGMYLTCKYALPHLVARGGGAIVNIASVAGIRWLGVPYVGYSATKGGVLQLTQSIAVQYAPDRVRANAVLPGFMDTPMIEGPLRRAYGDGDVTRMKAARGEQVPMGVMGDAWDVARAALFLASDEARYVTGAQLVVDGGLTAKC